MASANIEMNYYDGNQNQYVILYPMAKLQSEVAVYTGTGLGSMVTINFSNIGTIKAAFLYDQGIYKEGYCQFYFFSENDKAIYCSANSGSTVVAKQLTGVTFESNKIITTASGLNYPREIYTVVAFN